MNTSKKDILKSYRFPIIMLISVIIGIFLGIILKEKTVYIKPLGDIFLNLMFTVVVPLVFFTVSSSIASMINLKRLSKILKYTFILFFITSLIASAFMLIVTLIINPVGSTTINLIEGSGSSSNIGEQIVKMLTVNDFGLLLSRSNILPLIIFAGLFGISVSLISTKNEYIKNNLIALTEVMMKMIKIIMYYAPIGICAYFATLVGEFGPELIGSYSKSMILYFITAIVYFFIFYTVYSYIAGGKKGVKKFYQNILNPVATSLATQSSLATLPTNMEATKKIGVPKDISEVSLPIGTTMHMEGSSMGSVLKIIFLFSLFGIELTGANIISALLIAVLSGVVMAGIPGGGLIGEMLIVNLYGFPMSAFPIIATIGWLIDAPATTLNVIGDTTTSMMITRIIDGEDWLEESKRV